MPILLSLVASVVVITTSDDNVGIIKMKFPFFSDVTSLSTLLVQHGPVIRNLVRYTWSYSFDGMSHPLVFLINTDPSKYLNPPIAILFLCGTF